MQTNVDIATPNVAPGLTGLSAETVPIGTPLEWPIVDADGSLLFDRGAVIIGADEHRFLFTQFKPQRGDVTEPGSASHAAAAASDVEDTLSVNDMHLSIGALIGMRPQGISGASMHPGRIIGYAPNQSLFVTPALVDGRPLPLSVGENVEIVAIASQAVFRFVCTVDAVCPLPFGYAVLSKPGMIRRLRERKSIRVRTRLPVRFGLNVAGDAYEGLGVAQTISALGVSFGTPWAVAKVGHRLRLSFRLQSKEVDTTIETTAVIRNVQPSATPDGLATHGLEFEHLDPMHQLALKSFVFDRIDDVMHWSTATK